MCKICGVEEEMGFHAVVNCTKAWALRQEMRRHWSLPEESWFRYTGPDWLLVLLGAVDDERRAKTLLLLWRAWHLRNLAVHAEGEQSPVQLCSYQAMGNRSTWQA
jgi:hypothetical protein